MKRMPVANFPAMLLTVALIAVSPIPSFAYADDVPEAAVYGVPVFFGPNNRKFREARELIEAGGCFEIHSADDFNRQADRLFADAQALTQAGQAAGRYISNNAGATDAVFSVVRF